MKKEIILPEILQQSNKATTFENFLKPFGITKIFITHREYRRKQQDVYHCYIGDIKDNSFNIEKEVCTGFNGDDIEVGHNEVIKNIGHGYINHLDIQGRYLVTDTLMFRGHFYSNCPISFFDKKNCFVSKVYIDSSIYIDNICSAQKLNDAALHSIFNFNRWTPQKNKILALNHYPIQSTDVGKNILQEEYPYVYKYLHEKNYTCHNTTFSMLCCPQIEILEKAGYSGLVRIFKHISRPFFTNESAIKKFNTLIKKGSSPKEIIQMSDKLAKTMKECTDISKWDTFRKLEKQKHLTTNTLIDLYEENYDRGLIDKIGKILRRKYNDKNIFTSDSLINYLQRLDRFEAIDRYEAVTLLDDYLRMCEQLNLKPKVDGDSLKREHDICARMSRQVKQKEYEQGIEKQGLKLKPLTYKSTEFEIRPIADYDDLIEEANIQHNCVASYASSIASGRTNIFSLSKNNERYATVEIKLGDDLRIVQAYQKYNKPISDKARGFLNDWLCYIQTKSKVA